MLRLKCTKFDFRWGSAPDPTRGAYSAPTDPLAVFRRNYFEREGGEGKEMERGREKKRKGREMEGEGKGRRECKGGEGKSGDGGNGKSGTEGTTTMEEERKGG